MNNINGRAAGLGEALGLLHHLRSSQATSDFTRAALIDAIVELERLDVHAVPADPDTIATSSWDALLERAFSLIDGDTRSAASTYLLEARRCHEASA